MGDLGGEVGYGWLWIKMKNPGEWAHVQGCFRIFRRNVESNKFFLQASCCNLFVFPRLCNSFASLRRICISVKPCYPGPKANRIQYMKLGICAKTNLECLDHAQECGFTQPLWTCLLCSHLWFGRKYPQSPLDCRKLHQGLSSLSWIRPLHSRAAQAIWRSHSKYIRVSIDFLAQCQALSSSMHSFQTQLQHFVPFGFLWL